ncbi:kinase-like domain-containing protein [Favolaschia claudopus]|uniref:Kinase-like domain-containing protein n=1 Tax=Favolaschia claudopus TaxID=2862362 RepID=A0AAW0C7J4_9AGAR
MSHKIELTVFDTTATANEAIALGNPTDHPIATPLDPGPLSAPDEAREREYSSWACTYRGSPPVVGATQFVIGADPHNFTSGAAFTIFYERNLLQVCVENDVLDDPEEGLPISVVNAAVEQVQWESSPLTTKVQFHTAADGSYVFRTTTASSHQGLDLEKGLVLPENTPTFPHIDLSSLRPTHKVTDSIYVIKVSHGPAVFKRLDYGSMQEVNFFFDLPKVDFLLRPTHLVVDDRRRGCGLLLPYHRALSLSLTLDRHHPDAAKVVLSPAVAAPSDSSSSTRPTLISPLVKTAWIADVAATVAWLHKQNMTWDDLKTSNIVVCEDGHCRGIDYAPFGTTVKWNPPEAAQPGPRTTAADVFALGLVIWAVCMEVGEFERQQEYVCPVLVWNQAAPDWLRTLAARCVLDEPEKRPRVDVYDAILTERSRRKQ